jgi:hypothetical protein
MICSDVSGKHTPQSSSGVSWKQTLWGEGQMLSSVAGILSFLFLYYILFMNPSRIVRTFFFSVLYCFASKRGCARLSRRSPMAIERHSKKIVCYSLSRASTAASKSNSLR